MKMNTIAGFANSKTAANIAEATAVSYFGRKEMQAHYGLDVKATANMELKNN